MVYICDYGYSIAGIPPFETFPRLDNTLFNKQVGLQIPLSSVALLTHFLSRPFLPASDQVSWRSLRNSRLRRITAAVTMTAMATSMTRQHAAEKRGSLRSTRYQHASYRSEREFASIKNVHMARMHGVRRMFTTLKLYAETTTLPSHSRLPFAQPHRYSGSERRATNSLLMRKFNLMRRVMSWQSVVPTLPCGYDPGPHRSQTRATNSFPGSACATRQSAPKLSTAEAGPGIDCLQQAEVATTREFIDEVKRLEVLAVFHDALPHYQPLKSGYSWLQYKLLRRVGVRLVGCELRLAMRTLLDHLLSPDQQVLIHIVLPPANTSIS
jgi:hypothetical protein